MTVGGTAEVDMTGTNKTVGGLNVAGAGGDGLRRAGSSGTLAECASVENAAPLSLPPILRVASGSTLETRKLSVSGGNLSVSGGNLSASGSGLLRVRGLLRPLFTRSRSRGDTFSKEEESGSGRTRLVFWPLAGPNIRRGSAHEYEVIRRSNDSVNSLEHDSYFDSTSFPDLTSGKSTNTRVPPPSSSLPRHQLLLHSVHLA